MYVCVYVYICTHAYGHTCIYIYTHTHTHINTHTHTCTLCARARYVRKELQSQSVHPKAYSDDMGHYVRLYLAAEIEVCDLLVHPPGKDFRLVHPCVPWPNDGSQHLPRVAKVKVPVTKQTVCLMRWRLQGGELLDQGPFSALCVCVFCRRSIRILANSKCGYAKSQKPLL